MTEFTFAPDLEQAARATAGAYELPKSDEEIWRQAFDDDDHVLGL